MSDIKVGDVVAHNDNIGIVVAVASSRKDGFLAIEMMQESPYLHNCHGQTRPNRGWYCLAHDLRVLKPIKDVVAQMIAQKGSVAKE